MIADLNAIALIIEDLNAEITQQLGQDEDHVQLMVTAHGISIVFAGMLIFSSEEEAQYEDLSINQQIDLNERKPFEKHLRLLINDRINLLKQLQL